MQFEVGKIYDGVVKGITAYGAFVEIDKNTTGMVHISEIANSYVNDIKEHLKENQTVKVKIIGVNEAGKISLSIKKAVDGDNADSGKMTAMVMKIQQVVGIITVLVMMQVNVLLQVSGRQKSNLLQVKCLLKTCLINLSRAVKRRLAS